MSWDFELRRMWDRLEEGERWLARGGSNDGDTLYDSLGRVAQQMIVAVSLEEELTRIQRVRRALDDSGPEAERMIAERLAGIDFATVRSILIEAVKDVAFYLGGSVALGTVGGASVGALFGGVGAMPGAYFGGFIGIEVGGLILGFLGLKCLAEGLIDTIPEAVRCYCDGVMQAWGPNHWDHEQGSHAGLDGHLYFATAKIARGHVLLLTALLMAMVAYLTRGKGNRSLLLKQIRESKRLGPKIAEWLEKNEGKLKEHPALKMRERPRAASEEAPSQAMTPSQIRAAIRSKSGPKANPPAPQVSGNSFPRVVLSGHGSLDLDRPNFVVPEGTSVTVYSRPGATISDRLGNAIENNEDLGNVFSKKFAPGETMPDYILHPPDGLNIQGSPKTVDVPTPLSTLVEPKMGEVHWAACTYCSGTANSNLMFDTTGIMDTTKDIFIKVY